VRTAAAPAELAELIPTLSVLGDAAGAAAALDLAQGGGLEAVGDASAAVEAVTPVVEAVAPVVEAVTDVTSVAEAPLDATGSLERYEGWLSPLADSMEATLRFFQTGLKSMGVPYTAGFSIILTTLCVKVITYPLTRIQVVSQIDMQKLQPEVKEIKKRWEDDDKDRMNQEIQKLYDRNGVNTFAGCFPILVTLPVFWGLYKALNNASIDGIFTEPFFWIPNLAGPPANGMDWLLPLSEPTPELPIGAPPLGWDVAGPYLVVPTLLVASQFISMELLKAPKTDDGSKEEEQQLIALKLLPFLIGWFSLNVPAGLGIYWLANNFLTTSTTLLLRKIEGFDEVMKAARPKVRAGTAIRTTNSEWAGLALPALAAADGDAGAGEAGGAAATGEAGEATVAPPKPVVVDEQTLRTRSKRPRNDDQRITA